MFIGILARRNVNGHPNSPKFHVSRLEELLKPQTRPDLALRSIFAIITLFFIRQTACCALCLLTPTVRFVTSFVYEIINLLFCSCYFFPPQGPSRSWRFDNKDAHHTHECACKESHGWVSRESNLRPYVLWFSLWGITYSILDLKL